MTSVTFIGLGNMGRPMARALLNGGHSVCGYDILGPNRDALVAIGGTCETTLAASLIDAEVVITMVPTGKHVRSIYEGINGVLALARPGTLLIDCSTIDVESSRAVHAAAKERGFDMLDAPVTGAVPAAENATLTFMVGGSKKVYDRALPTLQAMGKSFHHVGEAGSGHALKICNNMMTGMSMVAISEVFGLAEQFGLDFQTVFDVISTGSANCWALSNYCPVPGPVPSSPANRDYAPLFPLAGMLKDMRLSQSLAASLGANTPLAASTTAIYQLAVSSGLGDQDFSAIFKMIGGRSNTQGASNW